MVAVRKIDEEAGALPAARPDDRLVPAGDASMIAMIERIVMDPSIPLDRLERMLEMKERMEDRAREDEERRARKAYHAAMSACQKELPVVAKNRKNEHTNSQYADLAAIEEQAMPVIHKHGFSVSFQPNGYNEKGELLIKWEIAHEEGYSRSDVAGIPLDSAGSQGRVNKTGTQAFGSTATYGRRYLLCMLFNISTGDDRDGNAPVDASTITDEQKQRLVDLMQEVNADAGKFLAFFRIATLEDLPAKAFGRAVAMLNKKGQTNAGH